MPPEIHARLYLVKFFLHPIDFFDPRRQIALFSGDCCPDGQGTCHLRLLGVPRVGIAASCRSCDNVFTPPADLG